MRKRILSTLLALCLALSLLPASALAAGGEQKSYVALGETASPPDMGWRKKKPALQDRWRIAMDTR